MVERAHVAQSAARQSEKRTSTWAVYVPPKTSKGCVPVMAKGNSDKSSPWEARASRTGTAPH